MRVIYQSDMATVYLGDSEEVLGDRPKESVDLVVTDPPYGVQWRSNNRIQKFDKMHNDATGDRQAVHDILSECVRVIGQNRHLYIFGPSDVLEGLKISKPVTLVWDKGRPGMGDLTSPWGPQHETISFAVSKFRHAGQVGDSPLPARMRKGTILRFSPPTGRTVRHPSEKPVPLLRELIESSSRQGDTVLDPFAGVGSTAVAAILAGRKTIAVEIDENYAKVAVERIRNAEGVLSMQESA